MTPGERGCTGPGSAVPAPSHPRSSETGSPGKGLLETRQHGWEPLQAPARPKTRHPPPPQARSASPQGGRELGGSGGTHRPATQPHQVPTISCSCHITILPGACPNNQRDCGRRKPEGDGAASRASLAGDPHAAPQCPAQCAPRGTPGWDGALPDPTAPLSHLSPHPAPQCQQL